MSRVAVATGGGLDSAALLALANAWAQRTGGTAFGVALDFESIGDDRPHLRALQAYLGCEVMRVRPEAAASRCEAFERGVDAAPLTWPSGTMEIELLVQARAAGAEVVLSGAGADELFDGDPRSFAAVMRAGRVSNAVREVRRLRGFDRPRSSVASWLLRPLVSSMVPVGLRRLRARGSEPSMPPWVGPRLEKVMRTWHAIELERTLGTSPVPEAQRQPSPPSSHHEQLLWLRHQQEVAADLERRDPYLDGELIEFVRGLPPYWLLTGGRRRGLFREAMRGVLPESVRLRDDKAGFEPALARFVSAIGGHQRLRPLADVRYLADLGIVRPRAFEDDFQAFVSSLETSDAWSTVWPALAVESFLRSRDGGLS
ncbi:Asparagine synthetase [Labilithrix luteola]|uniref:asparagine synthase (glutamine-hydrolyzing) n=1 Tax=Labilithrix luteola TaxID=1391654 RepID=A0A0K1Q575_9BACT|nr:Asparagine synthetase [Labilithrix luteola]